MEFSKIIENLKNGDCVYRKSWTGSEKLFIFKQVPSRIPGEIVPKMTSLPEQAKTQFMSTFRDARLLISSIYYSDQLAVVGLYNKIDSYSVSADDIFANDWEVYE